MFQFYTCEKMRKLFRTCDLTLTDKTTAAYGTWFEGLPTTSRLISIQILIITIDYSFVNKLKILDKC